MNAAVNGGVSVETVKESRRLSGATGRVGRGVCTGRVGAVRRRARLAARAPRVQDRRDGVLED